MPSSFSSCPDGVGVADASAEGVGVAINTGVTDVCAVLDDGVAVVTGVTVDGVGIALDDSAEADILLRSQSAHQLCFEFDFDGLRLGLGLCLEFELGTGTGVGLGIKFVLG